MPIKKAQKIEIVKELGEAIKKANSAVFVKFHKLNVADTTQLRRGLRGKGISYTVAKKTLVKRALADAHIEGDMPELPGEFAFAYGDDLLAPAREVYGFQRDHKDNLEIVGGIFGRKFKGKEEMIAIASIPPVEVLYGQFVNLINSPIQRFVVALGQIAKSKEPQA
jgi:large subunit ribosomal protein L10